MTTESSDLLSAVLVHTRGAIALNNFGVSLLERGCYAQALETFRDALHTQKHGLTAKETGRIDPDYRVLEKLQRAMRRVSNPEPLPRRAPLVVLSSENLSTDAGHMMKRGPSAEELCAIRIDLWETEGLVAGSPASSPVAETALLLYNFAVAHVCLARVPALARPGHVRGAVTLFEAAYRVLRPARDNCGDDTMRTYGLLSLEAIVLVGLLGVLLELDQVEQAKSLYSHFLYLKDAMRLMEGLEQCFRRGKFAASAA